MASITVKGMSCNHCKASVEKTMSTIPGVADVNVNLETGEVSYNETSPVEKARLSEAIKKIGFEVE